MIGRTLGFLHTLVSNRDRTMRAFVTVAVAWVALSGAPASAQTPISFVLRLLATAAMHGGSGAVPRDPEKSRLAQDFVFNSIPRAAGTRFVVVANEQQFASSGTSSILLSTGLAILFVADPFARIPDQIANEVNNKCSAGWATLQYLSDNEPYESFAVTCGSGGSPNNPTVVKRTPEQPGEYQGAPKVHRIQHLEASLEALEITNQGSIRAIVRLKNTSAGGVTVAVALKARHSDGIADFWKFFPQADGELSDNAGNSYTLLEAAGIGYARELSDWAFLRSGEERFATLTFGASGRAGSSFALSFGIWLGFRDGAHEQRPGMYRVRLSDIRPRRS
jgi:hypothetical protein